MESILLYLNSRKLKTTRVQRFSFIARQVLRPTRANQLSIRTCKSDDYEFKIKSNMVRVNR